MTTLPLCEEIPSVPGSNLIPTPTASDATRSGTNLRNNNNLAEGGRHNVSLHHLIAHDPEFSISSPGATRASHSHSPGSAWARKMTAISGRTLLRSLPISGPVGACLRTLLGTSLWGSTVCYLTWKKSATPAGRLLYRLVPSTPPTGATEFGFWPTPRAADPGSRPNGNGGRVLSEEVLISAGIRERGQALWPTPRASENENRQTKPSPSQLAGTHGKSLAAEVMVSLLPTASASNHKGSSQPGQRRGQLSEVVAGQKLNPDWVTVMMGLPVGWLDLED